MTRVLFVLRWLLRLPTPARTILHWPEDHRVPPELAPYIDPHMFSDPTEETR